MLKSGHRIVPVLGEEGKRQCEDFEGNQFGTIRLDPGRWLFTASTIEVADQVYDFKFRPSDTLVSSFYKVGSTWIQEVVWALQHNYDLDSKNLHLSVNFRSPCIEADMYARNTAKTILEPGSDLHARFTETHPTKDPKEGIFFQLAELADDPRVIKTHLPFEFFTPSLLDTCKVVYVSRDPKDVVVSYYKFSRLFRVWGYKKESLSEFVDYFVNDGLMLCPYWTHIQQAWSKRHHPNFHFCYFEDFKKDAHGEIRRLSDFLGLQRTDHQINNVAEFTHFKAMQARDNMTEDGNSPVLINTEARDKEGGFFNKGKVGTWKEKLNDEDIAKLNVWIKKNLQDFDDDYKYKKDYF